jgi:hypothetical protein
MASEPVPAAPRPAEVVAGFLASFAIFASLTAVVWHPLRLLPISILLALIAAAIGGRYKRLAFFAVMTTAVCFVAGMTVAVLVQHPLW